jgi:hypothetical protein
VGQLQHFLDADSGMPQHFHRRPRPERRRFLMGEVPPFGRGQVDGVDAAGLTLAAALQFLTPGGKPAAGNNSSGGVDAFLGIRAVLLDGPQQRR